MNLYRYKLLKFYLKINKRLSKYTIEQIIVFLQKISWIFLILILLVIFGSIVFGKVDKILSLIAAVGILLSALLASYSMLLNISKNIELKNIEHSNIVRSIFFQLCLIKMRLIGLLNEKQKDKVSFMDIDRMFDTVEDIALQLQEIKTQDIVTTANNNVLSTIHFVYLEVLTIRTVVKAARKSLIKQDSTKENPYIFPNPLKEVDIILEGVIDELNSILTYLKNGYKKDFPNEEGIEACAEYKYEGLV